MKRSLGILLVGILLIGLVAVSGCADSSEEKNTNSNSNTASDELVAAVGTHGGEPEDGFNPIIGWGHNHEPLVQSTLFKRDSNTDVINDLATDHTISEDGLTWTVNIRNGVKFHDGVPLTAKDVAFTFNKAARSAGLIDLSMMEKATAIDDDTIEFKLNETQSTFINKLIGVGIVPEHAYTESYGQNPIGSGPYVFKQWNKGQQVIFEANPDYYGQEPYFKKLTIVFMEGDAAFAAAKSGQIDIAEIPATYAGQTVKDMKILSIPSIDACGITLPVEPDTGEKTGDGYPVGNDVTSDIAIRKALNIGIDRQSLVDGALNGQGEAEFTGVDKLPWVNEEALFSDNRLDEAKSILNEAGWVDTDGDGIVEKNGVKAEFTLLYAANAQDRQALAVAVSEQAKRMGINIKIEGASWDKIQNLAMSTPVVFKYGSIDPTDVYLRYHSQSHDPSNWNNMIRYSNPIVDGYLKKAITSPNEDTSIEYWQLAAWNGETGYSQKGDSPWLWMATINHLYIMDEDLDIATPVIQPHGGNIFGNILEWKRTGN
jgi:peptide/nickel transport system substrate-binding protein